MRECGWQSCARTEGNGWDKGDHKLQGARLEPPCPRLVPLSPSQLSTLLPGWAGLASAPSILLVYDLGAMPPYCSSVAHPSPGHSGLLVLAVLLCQSQDTCVPITVAKLGFGGHGASMHCVQRWRQTGQAAGFPRLA